MSLSGLPEEIIRAILEETLLCIGIHEIMQLRLVSSLFDMLVESVVFSLKTFECKDDGDSPELLRRHPNMNKALIARLVLAKMGTHNADKRVLCVVINQTAEHITSDIELKGAIAKALSDASAHSMFLWDLVSHLSPTHSPADTTALFPDDRHEHALIAAVGIQNSHLVEGLLDKGAKGTKETRPFGSAFSLAARLGSRIIVNLILQTASRDGKMTAKHFQAIQMNALEEAVAAKHMDVVRLLLDSMAMTEPTHYYDHVINSAVRVHHNELADLLLSHRIPFLGTGKGVEARFWINLFRAAACSNNVQFMPRLLAMQDTDELGLPLEDASRHGHVQIVNMLLPRTAPDQLSAAMYWAARKGDKGLVDLLLEGGAKSDDALLAALSAATFNNQAGIIQHLAYRKDTSHWLDSNGCTSLVKAASEGLVHKKHLRMMVGSSPAEPTYEPLPENVLSEHYNTLKESTNDGDFQSTRRFFSEFQARYHSINHMHMWGLLDEAVQTHRIGFLSLFAVILGATSRQMPIEAAIEAKSVAVLQICIDFGWDINTSLHPHNPPVIGFLTADIDLIQWFLSRGADMHARFNWDITPVSGASIFASVTNLKFCLERSGYITEGQPAFMALQRKDDDDLVIIGMLELIFRCGFPLHGRIYENDRRSWVEHKLMGAGTLLHHAACLRRLEIMSYLLSKGADPATLDTRNRTVFDQAQEENHLDIIQHLQSEVSHRKGSRKDRV